MADKKISELNSASAVYDADDFALVQDAETKQVNASVVKTYVKDGLSKSDVGLANVDNTSDATKNAATVTLTNKTISGSSNTLSDISNASLTNSAITINGNAVSLGGSTTVTATASNALTLGTGLTGTSYNGSTAVTTAIDTSVVTTLSGTQTLTNKTLTSPIISGGTIDNAAIGGTTPASGAFTTLSASSTVSGTGFSTYLASPPAIGGSSPAAGNFTTLGATGNVTLGDASTDTVQVNGYMGVGGAGVASRAVYITSSALTGASQYGLDSRIVATSAATADATGVTVRVSTAAASFTLPTAYGAYFLNASAGAGSTITTQHGIYIQDLTTATNNYGITSQVSSGTNKWNIYASGTAANYFRGEVSFGSTAYALADITTWATGGVSALTMYSTAGPGPVLLLGDSTATNGDTVGTLMFFNNGNTSATWNAATAKNIAAIESKIVTSDANAGTDSGGILAFYTKPEAGAITERLRIDSSGNLGLGVTPSAWSGTFTGLQIGSLGGANIGGTSNDTFYSMNVYYNGGWRYGATGIAASMYRQNVGTHQWFSNSSGAAGAIFTPTQVMTLTAAGNLLVGATSPLSGFKEFSIVGDSTNRAVINVGRATAATTGVAGSLVAYNGTAVVAGFDLQSNGANNSGYIGTFTYNAGSFAQGPYLNTGGTNWTEASDETLKDIIEPIVDGIGKVSTLRAVIGKFKKDQEGVRRAFLIAQDVQKVLPEAVVTGTDGKLGVTYTGTIPLLVAAIKELHAEIESLKAKVN